MCVASVDLHSSYFGFDTVTQLCAVWKASRGRVDFILVSGISMQFPHIYKGSAKRLAEAFAELSSFANSIEPIH